MAATNLILPLDKETIANCARCQGEFYQETLVKSDGYCGICRYYKDQPFVRPKPIAHCTRCKGEFYQETLDQSDGYCGICCFYKDKPFVRPEPKAHCTRCQLEYYQETLDQSHGFCGICCYYKNKPYQPNPLDPSTEVECIGGEASVTAGGE